MRGRRQGFAALTLAVALFGVLATAASAIPSRRLVWNASASAPIGLYWRIDGRPERGDLVLAWAPFWARRLADERYYLPLSVPLVKRVAAISGDVVCATGREIVINGEPVARRMESDHLNRLLPVWTGCRLLAPGDFLLLMADVPDSFDGRYFGVSDGHDIIGRLVPVWTR
ncbi:S26 family signal peptidase [Dongia sedimenti]|uniref:S26 family signal peptidase n=1 Tax=Dongia sedimenti TaxID=3064282 RepID=A0ABU0YUN9_9PROT|nr:S26 family signal peptidase [Rhodospirillaceae bacterium R-7]